MLLTLATTHRPATDLGFLLHKHPDKHQSFELPFGAARVFYPEASAELCMAALVLDVDPIALVRGPGAARAGRAACSTSTSTTAPTPPRSFLSVALRRVFASALAGRSEARPISPRSTSRWRRG